MLCKGKTFLCYDPGTVNGTEVKTLFEVEAMAESLTSESSSDSSYESSMEAKLRPAIGPPPPSASPLFSSSADIFMIRALRTALKSKGLRLRQWQSLKSESLADVFMIQAL